MSGIRKRPSPLERCPDEERLSELLDGDADAVQQASLHRHLESCPRCVQVLHEMRSLREGLGRLRGACPPPALFGQVAGAVQRHRRRSFWAGTAAVGGLSGAALAVGLLVASRVAVPVEAPLAQPTSLRASAEAEFRKAELHYRNALQMLETLVEEEKARWPRSRQTAFAADLRILVRAVEESRLLVGKAPEDPALQELLFSSYRAQLDYLREVLTPRSDDAI